MLLFVLIKLIKKIPNDEVFIDFKLISTKDSERIEKALSNFDKDVLESSDKKMTFDQTIMSISDQARISGYWDWNLQRSWTAYFEVLFQQNPRLGEVHVHFFDYDDQIPFMLCYSGDKAEMKVGPSKTALYSFNYEDFDDSSAVDAYKIALEENYGYIISSMAEVIACVPLFTITDEQFKRLF